MFVKYFKNKKMIFPLMKIRRVKHAFKVGLDLVQSHSYMG